MIDWASIESPLGLNWWEIDPGLQGQVRRHCPDEDLVWAEDKLSTFGALMGERTAANADVVDANPARLERYDRRAEEINTVAHHSAAIDTKRALWDIGYLTNFAKDREERGRRTPSIVKIAVDYLVSQADIGMACSVGQTNGVAKLVAKYAPDDLRDELLENSRVTPSRVLRTAPCS